VARELFIYWKLPEPQGSAAIAAVRSMHAALRAARPGLVCALHRRADIRDGLSTLMETYARPGLDVSADDEAAIAAAVARHLAHWGNAARHVETFIGLPA